MPYVYQQQQVIMSSGSCLPQMRMAPFDLNAAPALVDPLTTVIQSPRIHEEVDELVEEVTENVDEQDLENQSEESMKDDQMDEDEELNSKELREDSKEPLNDSGITFGESKSNETMNMEEISENWDPTPEDLDKACQTTSGSGTSPQIDDFNKKTYYYDNESGNAMNYESAITMEPVYEQQDPIYSSANILQSTEDIDFEVDGVPVIIGEFATNSMISQVDNFENINEGNVLMTIGEGGARESFEEVVVMDNEESMSRGSTQVNIQADERMPPRGELSGQESLGGASDINWNRLHYNEGKTLSIHL